MNLANTKERDSTEWRNKSLLEGRQATGRQNAPPDYTNVTFRHSAPPPTRFVPAPPPIVAKPNAAPAKRPPLMIVPKAPPPNFVIRAPEHPIPPAPDFEAYEPAILQFLETQLELQRGGPIRITTIIKCVSKASGFPIESLCGSTRYAALVDARHLAAFLCMVLTGRSFPTVGYYLGGRDHTTILHAFRRISSLLDLPGKGGITEAHRRAAEAMYAAARALHLFDEIIEAGRFAAKGKV